MKKILFFLVCFPMLLLAQVPQGINYQAVARDANGGVLMNQALTIQFSVISDITTSAVSWQETHSVSTNDYGLFTAIIGHGTSTSVGSSATFDLVDWGASNHLLKVEIDYGGGLVDMGTTAFMSVPYALYSANSATSSDVSYSIGDMAQGGIIFWVSADGKNGLVASLDDHCLSCNWSSAFEVVSDPSTHTSQGQQYRDWRVPTVFELDEMYSNIGPGNALGLGNIGNFQNAHYWSSTDHSLNYGYRLDFSSGIKVSSLKYAIGAIWPDDGVVRAVRNF